MPDGRERTIVLGGFMGTGKTTVGRIVADRLGRKFVDADLEIQAAEGLDAAAIFRERGEAAFRSAEARVCRELAGRSGLVVATGGGALLDPETLARFAESCLVIRLDCDPDGISRRIGGDASRPLLASGPDAVPRLLAGREAAYARMDLSVDTTRLSPEEAAEEVIRLWNQGY
ncbi:MAG: shikimate kinase [Spirochaetes bacterium]|nr:shikimate kinase [Spirochaetota bacterium]